MSELNVTALEAVLVDDAMVERACKANCGEREWSEFSESRRDGERIIMRHVLTTAMEAKP